MDKFGTLSLSAHNGLRLLAAEIQAGRKLRGWSEDELARRLGCARKTVRAIEAGQPTVAIGFVFEAAQLVGLDLFGGAQAIDERLAETRIKLNLLPQRVHARRPELNDDF
ncbi:helix-turn-helix domain-containing protein [Roseibium suaedae]|uniref:DNA-binding transcriptional regulator, XRE-family HTH domain n=1 Tax=Roseibium suaedae TaxID=735517 RepID=A0A1M7NQM1_9HYPH|nr:helix-turn-helix transcriptional regulator [Roseibium suaedae]SHN06162.1 DNA-binding transcriptional regulator, XRE-family HTH domain [Roseibium suaedae]